MNEEVEKIKTVNEKLAELNRYLIKDYKRPKEHENKIKLENISKHHFNYNFLVGGRSIGKTTTFQIEKLLFNIADSRRFQFVKVVRYEKQLKTKNPSWIKKEVRNILSIFGLTVIYWKNCYFIGHEELRSANGRPKKGFFDDAIIWGYCASINTYMDFRETDLQNPNIILEEEFAMYGEDGYLIDEMTKFLDIVSTVNRDRKDVSVWFIGNTMDINNPYFTYFGVDASILESGHLYTFSQQTDFEKSATVGLVFYGMHYQKEDEIPILLRVKNNKLATTINKYELPAEIINDNDWLYIVLQNEKFDEFYKIKCKIRISVDDSKTLIFENDNYKFDYEEYIIIEEKVNKNNIYILDTNVDTNDYGLYFELEKTIKTYKLDNDIRNKLKMFDTSYLHRKYIKYGSVNAFNTFKKYLKGR